MKEKRFQPDVFKPFPHGKGSCGKGMGIKMKKLKRALGILVALSMLISTSNLSVYASESSIPEQIDEDSVSSGDSPEVEDSQENFNETTESVYEAETYRVTFSLTECWEEGYNASVKIDNTGESIIENWALSFAYAGSISGIWNAVVDGKHNNGTYIIKNAGWNQDIEVGKSVEFGFGGTGNFPGFPQEYQLLGSLQPVTEEAYTIEYRLSSDWGSGFTGEILITNNTDTLLEDWILEFNFNRNITNIWNGCIEEYEDNHYIVKNAGYNSNIAAGGMVSIGFSGDQGTSADEPSEYKLYSYSCGDNDVNTEVDLTVDTDHDGVPDYVEDYFGTDKTKADTDGDGLSDYIELVSLVLNPVCADTDGNGIEDGYEDTDSDGLINIKECEIGTSIYKADPDGDGLSDHDEFMIYMTDPTKYDTDGDGVSDAKEIEWGTNPLVYDPLFSVNVEAADEDTVKASVEAVLSGEQAESLSVNKYEDEFFFPSNMPGYVGAAYEFSVGGAIDSAVIRFEFDETLLQDESFDPVIYYFNEDTQLLEELETTVTGNIASTEVKHFSKYILLNRTVFQSAFAWQDVWSTTGYSAVEVVLVIDNTGSMSYNDKNNKRLEVARGLVDKLPSDSKVGIVRFDYTELKLTEKLTDDKNIAKSYLTTKYFKAMGGTYMYKAISSDTGLHSSVIETANSKNIKIYTVGLGNSRSKYFTEYLKPLANNTAGVFYLASDANQLQEIYNDINKKIDIETDSDGDGIADYYEDNMVMFNGVTIKLDKNNPDSDGDGLTDGEEVAELNYQYNSDKSKVIVTGKLLSNPLEEDTDGDGISDEEEYIIGTNPRLADTDGDGLTDGFEYTMGFDPLNQDIDGDGRSDLQEYREGTDPYCYNKDWNEHVWDFVCGFIAGDFIADTDSLPTIMGQITSSLIPFVDIRDVAGNLVNGDYVFAGLSAIGLIPVAGDISKTAGKAGKFVLKNINDIPKVTGLLEFLNKNFPDVVKVLSKSDDFIDAAKKLSKADNIKLTRKQAKVITEAFENAGLSHYLIKTGNSLDLKDTVNIGSEIWEQGAVKRGKAIDEFINGHLSGNGLGTNFPVADRLLKDQKILVSTKSLDIAAQSYQNPKKLKNMLEKYADALKNIEKNYFKDGALKWGGTTLRIEQYDKKALEIVLPDVIITEDALKVLKEFKESMEKSGLEIWYRIAK